MTVTKDSRQLTASMVVLDPDTRAVLLVHHKAMNKWVFPGGHLDPDETLAECAVREVLEETNIEATVWDETGFVLTGGGEWHPSPWITAAWPAPEKPHKGEPAHTHIDHLFIGTADSTAPLKVAEGEAHGARWIRWGEGHDLDVRSEVPGVTRKAVEKMAKAGLL